MTVIRKQTLEEWFLCYQLRALSKSHFYNPVMLDADVTTLHEAYAARGKKPPYTAIMVKAIALVAKSHPVINRVVFDTFYGPRVVEFDSVNVNFPHLIKDENRSYLIASTVPKADEMSVAEIKAFIKEASSKKVEDTIISKHFVKNRNTFWMRAFLRLIHFVAYNFPRLYVSKGGGGISVSSLMNHAADDFDVHTVALGPTAFTLCAATVVPKGDRWVLKVSVGYDHFACHGNDAAAAVKELARVLRADTPELLEALT